MALNPTANTFSNIVEARNYIYKTAKSGIDCLSSISKISKVLAKILTQYPSLTAADEALEELRTIVQMIELVSTQSPENRLLTNVIRMPFVDIKVEDGATAIPSAALVLKSKVLKSRWKNERVNDNTLAFEEINKTQLWGVQYFLKQYEYCRSNLEDTLSHLRFADYYQIPSLETECLSSLLNHVDNLDEKTEEGAAVCLSLLGMPFIPSNSSVTNLLGDKISVVLRDHFEKGVQTELPTITFPIALDFKGSTLSNEELRSLDSVYLSGLDLESCPNLNAEIAPFLSRCSTLKKLSLASNKWVDDTVFETLPSTLQELNVVNCQLMPSFTHISNMALTKLNLSGTKIAAEALQHLPSSLTALALRRCVFIGDTPPSFSSLSRLEKLNIGITKTRDETVQTFPLSLISLNLNNTYVTDDSSAHISQMSRLRKLDLSLTVVTGKMLEVLPLSVEKLSLENNGRYRHDAPNITDFSFNHLLNLKKLSLFSSDIDDAVVQTLPPSLIKLNLRDNDEVKGKWNTVTDFSLPNLEELDIVATEFKEKYLYLLPRSLKKITLEEELEEKASVIFYHNQVIVIADYYINWAYCGRHSTGPIRGPVF